MSTLACFSSSSSSASSSVSFLFLDIGVGGGPDTKKGEMGQLTVEALLVVEVLGRGVPRDNELSLRGSTGTIDLRSIVAR